MWGEFFEFGFPSSGGRVGCRVVAGDTGKARTDTDERVSKRRYFPVLKCWLGMHARVKSVLSHLYIEHKASGSYFQGNFPEALSAV